MATVKTITDKIKTETHLTNSLEYTMKKANYVSYNLCCNENNIPLIQQEFRNIRKIYDKDTNIIAHHFVQSFDDKDNVSPELSHKIGLETIKRCFKEYQVVLSTHIDGKHIHNHFILNSVSTDNGLKYSDNKKSLALLRRTSDEICLEHNLSILPPKVDDKEKYIGVDAATLNLARRRKSWKYQLVKDLDEALEKCKSKDEFVKFFQNKDYNIRYQKHITFQKIGEKKGIRADNLASQFGIKYTKKNIDKHLGIVAEEPTVEKTNEPTTQQRIDYYEQLSAENWQREKKKNKYQKVISEQKFFDRLYFSKNPMQFTLRLILYFFITAKNKKARGKISYQGNKHYRVYRYDNTKKHFCTLRNIPYSTIMNAPGQVAQIKLYSWQIAKLLDENILLSSKINLQTGIGIVTVKKTDLKEISEILNINYNQVCEQANLIHNKKTEYKFKKEAGKLEYLVLTKEQVDLLNFYCITFTSYPKEDKFNVVFSETDKDKVLSILFPNRSENNKNTKTFFIRNAEINTQLKEEAEKLKQKLNYKIVNSNQYKALQKTTIKFAVFRKNTGLYNVVFLDKDKAELEKTIRSVAKSDKSKEDNLSTPTGRKI